GTPNFDALGNLSSLSVQQGQITVNGAEEATRALFAADAGRFAALTQPWPADVRDFARELARGAFETATAPADAPSASHEAVT
ncbi:DUF2239 family protein, partial [Ralstonia pseudosolanacearum]|uniref:DUF2239 family protein n=1 Tax=Ralstonia pseudosolanacearum TaxID=1310165 RepID=UPI003CE8FCFA